ncbi:MAG: iron-sulfur cluster repair protein YtfE [Proteobacteria bacterium]|nr:iron-sulfur cluster repair protein YtfE [Pseudomonadota bacterium]
MNISVNHLIDRGTIGEIAAALPGATGVFRSFKLDFCCGGNVTLADAVTKRGVDLLPVLDALRSLDQSADHPLPEAADNLIDYIQSRYHDTHRREIPELIRLSRKVESVHAEHPDAPRGLADMLAEVLDDLEMHMMKEEAVLFPMLRRGGQISVIHPIAQMRIEHERHGQHLSRLEEIAQGFRAPEGACRSWQALYLGLSKLVDDLIEHIHIENNILFVQFDKLAPQAPQHSCCCGSCGG